MGLGRLNVKRAICLPLAIRSALRRSDSRYHTRWCLLFPPPSWADLCRDPTTPLVSPADSVARSKCTDSPLTPEVFLLACDWAEIRTFVSGKEARTECGVAAAQRWRRMGGDVRSDADTRSRCVRIVHIQGDPLSRWISALRGRLSVLSILPIGCSRMLRVSPDHTALRCNRSWRRFAMDREREPSLGDIWQQPCICSYISLTTEPNARRVPRHAFYASGSHNAAESFTVTSALRGCFCGRLSLCPPVQRDSAGCMEGCGHGLHQENQNFGVHMRHPERHDQHRLPALCRLGH